MRSQLWLAALILFAGCTSEPLDPDNPPLGFVSQAQYDALNADYYKLLEAKDASEAKKARNEAQAALADAQAELAKYKSALSEKERAFKQLYAVHERTLKSIDSQAEELQDARRSKRVKVRRPQTTSLNKTYIGTFTSDNARFRVEDLQFRLIESNSDYTTYAYQFTLVMNPPPREGDEEYCYVTLKLIDNEGFVLDGRGAERGGNVTLSRTKIAGQWLVDTNKAIRSEGFTYHID